MTLDQSELAGLIASRPQLFAWFLGAGASRMSGLPTATDIIWDLKRRYYRREEFQDVAPNDLQNDAVRTRIQAFMDSRGFPALWSDEEYSTYFEKIFGHDKERQRDYIRRTLAEEKVTLTVGSRIFAALMANGFNRASFTTNFDSVVERAFAEVSGTSLSAFHLEGSHAALQALNNDEFPLYVKLHGDFRYDSVKNLPADLAIQNTELASCFMAASTRFGLVVTGYSGRDLSVMKLLQSALSMPNAFPHGLYWTGIKGSEPLPVVRDLLDEARSQGVKASYVEIETFDSFMLRLWRSLDDKPPELDRKIRRSLPTNVNIPIPATGGGKPLVRFNALPVLSLPTHCLGIALKRPMDWAEIRKIQADTEPRFVFTKAEEVWCWGAKTEIEEAFGNQLLETGVKELPSEGWGPDSLHIKAFLEEALAIALARGRPLIPRSKRSGSYLIVDPSAEDQAVLEPITRAIGRAANRISGLFAPVDEAHPEPQRVAWAEALHISLARKNGRIWLLVKPDIWIWPPRAREVATDFLDKRRAQRFNQKHNELLDAWVRIVIGSTKRRTSAAFAAFDGGSEAENPRFELASTTAYARRLK